MALVNQTIPGLFGGVSQQAPELRHDTQVTEMINCMPTVVGGVQKRRPSELVYTDSELPTDCFVYTYDRGAGNETYTIFIRDDGNFRIFDLVNKVWIGDWTYSDYLELPQGSLAIDSFSLTTVGDTTFVVNKTKTCLVDPTLDDNGDPNWDKNFYYWVSRTAGDNEDNSSLRYTYYIKSDDESYKGSPTSATTNGTLVNTNATFPSSATNGGTLVGLTLHNNTTAESSVIISNTATSISVADNTMKFSLTDEYEIVVQYTDFDSTTVVKELAKQINGTKDPHYTATTSGSVLKVTQSNGNKLFGSDSWGNQASSSWQGKVAKLQDLPNDFGFEGAVVEISGDDKISFDNYYVKYQDNVWLETFLPNSVNGVDNTTLPHKLTREVSPSIHFALNPAEYISRSVGDEFTASVPSFIDNTITDVFFYRNRLGFISNDNVILSETGEYYNFFPTTITANIDSDPIDVAVDSNKAVSLQYALPFNKELLIFGDKTQFVLSSTDTLTPNNVSVQQSTAFDTTKVKPVALGPNVYFVVEKNNYSNVLEYYNQPDTASNDASNTTAHCPNYLPINIKKLVGSSANDMVFALSTEENDTIYVYNFYWNGEEKAQSAWHKWNVDGVINNIEVINNELVLFITRNGNENIESIKLDTITDFDSLEYVDVDDTKYTSLITLTEIGFPSGKLQIDDKRNKLMLKNMQVNADYGSLYKVKVDKYNKPKKFMYNPGMLNVRPALTDLPIQTRNYDYVTALGFFPNQYLTPGANIFPGTLSYTMKSDNRYVITGDVKNLEISIYNDIEGGFKINSIDFLGSYVNKSRSV